MFGILKNTVPKKRRNKLITLSDIDLCDASEAFIRWIREMNAAMGIPDHIQEIRISDIPEMAHHAAQESNPLYPVPVLMDERELAAMYLKLMPRKEQNA